MVQNYITVAATALLPSNFTGYLPSHIKYSWTRSDTSVSPAVIPTIFRLTYPSLTPSLLPCADTKEVPSTPSSSPPPPDLRHSSNTWFLLVKHLLFWHDMDLPKEQVVAEGS